MTEQQKVYTLDEGVNLHYHARLIQYVISDNGCWEVYGLTPRSDGYYEVRRSRKLIRLHRYVYELKKGAIPEGFVVRRSCGNPKCINPSHLELGTRADVAQDTNKRRQQVLPEVKVCTKCGQEKPLDQFRTYITNGKKRTRSMCRECERIIRKSWRKNRERTFWEKLKGHLYRKAGSISIKDLKKLGYPEGQDCYLCGKLIENREDAEIDHILPLAKGGGNKGNLAWAHRICNRIKHDLTMKS